MHSSTILEMITKFFYWWLSSEDHNADWTVCDVNHGAEVDNDNDNDVDGWCLLPVAEWVENDGDDDGHHHHHHHRSQPPPPQIDDIIISPSPPLDGQSTPKVVLKEGVDLIGTSPLVHGNHPGHYTAISRFLLIGDIEECIIPPK